jgi:hypothetical protein
MNASFSSRLPRTSLKLPPEPRSLSAIAMALATCRHPEACRIGANVIVTARAVCITRCSACGALSSDEDPPETWQPSALAALLAKGPLEELSALVRGIRTCARLADEAASAERTPPPPPDVVRALHSILSALARTAIVREQARAPSRPRPRRATSPQLAP